jgi:lipopolysaccharide transport system permease protein
MRLQPFLLVRVYRSTAGRRALMLALSAGVAMLVSRRLINVLLPDAPWDHYVLATRIAVVAVCAAALFALTRLGGVALADARRLYAVADTRSSGTAVRWYRYANPVGVAYNLGRHRHLLRQLVARDVAVRYRGSYLGVLWSMVMPLMMLAIYAFVFSVVFQARWAGSAETSRTGFALTLFAGLIAFNVFSECVNRAPALVVASPNYVKRVIFPLEILPASVVGSALFHALVSAGVLAAGLLLASGRLPWTILLVPVAAVPLAALGLGLGWFLASLGVFVRDTAYVAGIATQMLFFLTPIFYPIEAVPAGFRTAMWLNPLTAIVDGVRRVTIWGRPPDWAVWTAVTAASVAACVLGYAWFMKTKAGFADVL